MVELRKIITKEDIEKKRKRNYLIIGILIIFLMAVSPAAYGLFSGIDSGNSNGINEIVKYNNVKFVKGSSGYWEFTYDGKNFMTKYNPLELNETKSNVFLSFNTYQGQVLSFNWNESQEGVIELRRNLEGNSVPLRVVPRVCLTENCSFDIPIKDCTIDKVISFRIPIKDEKERIYKEDNCVFIVANETNQVKYADAFLYNMIGI